MSESSSTENTDTSPNAQLATLVSSSLQARGFIQDANAESFRTSLENGSVTSEQWRKLASAKVKASHSASTDVRPKPSKAEDGGEHSPSRDEAES